MHTAWTIFWSYDLMMSSNMRWLQWVKGNSTVLRTKNDQTPTFPNHLTFQFTSKSPMFIQKEASFKIWLTIQKKHRFARSSPLNHIFPMICGIPTVAKNSIPGAPVPPPPWRRRGEGSAARCGTCRPWTEPRPDVWEKHGETWGMTGFTTTCLKQMWKNGWI